MPVNRARHHSSFLDVEDRADWDSADMKRVCATARTLSAILPDYRRP
jgi:hypothetical protein